MSNETQSANANANEPSEEQLPSNSGEELESDIQGLYDRMQRLADERDQLKDQVLRAMADFQNFKRRNQQEMTTNRQLATESLVRELLPVLDNFERSIEHLQGGATVDTVLEGVRAVERQLRQILEAHNVRRIPAVGQAFDPQYHEALGTEESEEHPDNVVTSEIQPGYTMGPKVIRPARVKVSKSGP